MPGTFEKLRGAVERWLTDVYGPQAKKARAARFATTSDLEIPPVATPLDWDAALDGAYEEKLGLPGEYPFTRGVQPTMYRGRPWTMRQYAGFGSAEETNARFHYLLKSGQTGLSTAFDLPTQMGRDADHPRAAGEVGRAGVSIGSVEDLERLFAGIPLGDVSTSMTINATASILLALYEAVGERQGVPAERLQGTIQNDVLKEYIARGTYIYPPAPSMRIVTDIFAYATKRLPRFNPISISGYHIREAGSTAAQEIAFTLADGVAYVDAAVRAGLDVDAFAGRLSFFFNVHNNFLEEIAKFRAARRLWARLMKERFHATDPRSMMLRFHAQTAGSTLTAQQPDNNVVRVALQAMAAVLGGTQSLHTNAFDEALALPTQESARLALRTQQIIAHESGVADFIDPLGGAWALEKLTDELEQRATAYLAKIDEKGGMVRAIEQGYPQAEIEEAAFRAQRDVEDKRTVVVGVNEFQLTADEAPPAPHLHRIDPELEPRARASLAALRRSRDSDRSRRACDAVSKAARGTENLMPLIVEAVKANATLGELSDALRDVFGEHRG